jgi:type IV secretion system protein VirD4
MQESPVWDGLLARLGGELTHFIEKEKSSVLTTCGRFLRFLNTPAMVASTRSSSFIPQLKRQVMTVHIVLPPERMKAQMGWLRLIVGAMIRAVVRDGLSEYPNVHFILDEAASLGVLDSVEDLVDKYRGYGCRAQFYYQSAGQLIKCWPKDQGQTLMSNATAKIFFGVNDIQTANLVSSMLGKETIIIESGGGSTSGGANTGWSEAHQGASHSGGRSNGWSNNESWQQGPRELLKPEELLNLPPRIAITFPGGGVGGPVLTKLVRYFEEPGFAALAKGGSWLSRVRSACRTVIGSAIILTAGIVLAILVTQAIDAQAKARRHDQSAAGEQWQFSP